jgi:hypothetical protein
MSVNQKGAQAGGDIVGGDKIVHNYAAEPRRTKLELLKARLKKEVEDEAHCTDLIDQLQNYQKPLVEDGVVGLEAKLEVSGRSAQLMTALEMKEQFSKLLDKWSLYVSAQEIFAHLLAMAHYKYTHQIFPQIGKIDDVSIDELVDQKIVTPAIDEVGIDVFSLDHQTAMGMVYWLAEQCRVKWHV